LAHGEKIEEKQVLKISAAHGNSKMSKQEIPGGRDLVGQTVTGIRGNLSLQCRKTSALTHQSMKLLAIEVMDMTCHWIA